MVFAQAVPGTSTEVPEIDQPISRVTVSNVVAPVLVTDRTGNSIIDGLQPAQFHLWDNNKEQNIQVDVSFEPISIVIAIEASVRMDAILKQVRHLGSLMPVLIGNQGEAAVIAFDHRIRLMQDFTNDPDKIKVAIDRINAGSSSSRMIDSVDRAVYMLRKRPPDNRKIILLISETRDQASEGKVKEALQDAQLSNVLIYAVNVTQFAVRLTEKPQPPRPDPLPPTAYNLPMGVAPTPTSIANAYGVQNQAQFVPLLKEIFTDVKRIFVDNPTEVFAKGTGGTEFSFLKERAMEDAIQRISQEIHSQYLISYRPNNAEEGGFHEIAVRADCNDCVARTRPGYYIGGGKIQ
jgi:VWFA-related protein